jgi:hypothetical protein
MTTQQRAQAMTKRERVDYLKAHGWHRFSSRGSQTWIWRAESRRFFTLAAAIRVQLEMEAGP